MAGVLDPDTHIAEPPPMWDYLEPEWRPRRPVIVNVPDDTVYGGSDHVRLIDGISVALARWAGHGFETPWHRRPHCRSQQRSGQYLAHRRR